MDNHQTNIGYLAHDLKNKYSQLKELVNAELKKNEDEDWSTTNTFTTEDCIVYTEEYALEYFEGYISKNRDYIDSLKKMPLENKLKDLETANENLLSVKANENSQNIKIKSLDSILALKNMTIRNRDTYIKYYPIIEKGISANIKNYSRNLLNPEKIPKIVNTNSDYYYLIVDIYSSVRNKKVNEFWVRNDCLVSELFNSIDCFVSGLDNHKYNKLLWLNNQLLIENDPDKVNAKNILLNSNRDLSDLKVQVLQAEHTTIEMLNIDFDTVYILRDNLNCDHFVIFTNLSIGEASNGDDNHKIINSFVPDLRRRNCELCNTKKANYIVRKSHESILNVFFTCKDCYINYYTDSDGKLLDSSHEIFDYMFEEKAKG